MYVFESTRVIDWKPRGSNLFSIASQEEVFIAVIFYGVSIW
jgi:hypothetical protein